MATLTEAEKKTILGVNYKQLDGVPVTPEAIKQAALKKFTASVDKCDSNKFNALALAFLGVVLLGANLSAMSGPPVMLVSAIAVVLMLAGAGWFIYTSRELTSLRAATSKV